MSAITHRPCAAVWLGTMGKCAWFGTWEMCLVSHWNSSLSLCVLQTCQVGLNFASEEETKRFRSNLLELIGRRQRKTGSYRQPSPPNLTSALPPCGFVTVKITPPAVFDLVLTIHYCSAIVFHLSSLALRFILKGAICCVNTRSKKV